MITREQLLTPGARFLVTQDFAPKAHKGDVVKLLEDDGTDIPWFIGDRAGRVCLRLDQLEIIQDAMTLRDQMAMTALASCIDRYHPTEAAIEAYRYADAMMAERVKVRT